MNWDWRQTYDAALHEKDPSRLAERLVIAEKAILERLQELPGPAGHLPEGRALREALDRLYAFYPHEHHPPGQIQDDDIDPARRNWIRLILPVGLGLTLASATAWMAARRNDLNDAHRMAAATEMKALRNSRAMIIPDALDNRVTDPGPYKHKPSSAPAPNLQDPYVVAQSRANEQGVGTHGKDPNVPPETPGAQRDPFVVRSLRETPDLAQASDHFGYAPEAQVENAPPRDSGEEPAVRMTTNPAVEPVEKKSTSPVAAEPQKKLERPRGTVSVSISTYPSLRVPPELNSKASSLGASLQIGELISRTDPTYPEDAEKQDLEGTVKLRATVGKDGTVQNVDVLNGPPMLASVALVAVRQWRYKPTLLGDQAIEVAQDITIVFRLLETSDHPN